MVLTVAAPASSTVAAMSEQEAGRDSGYVTGVLGFVFFIVILIILILVIAVFKAYKTTFQRLILYYIIIGLLCELTFGLQIELNLGSQSWICVPIIYFYLYFPLAGHLYITTVTNWTFLVTVLLLRGSTKLWKSGKCVECFCIVITIIVPVAYIWLPIQDGSYEALNCNLSDKDSDMTRWTKDAIILNLMVMVMCLEVVFVCIVLCFIFCFVRWRLQNWQTTGLLKTFLYYTIINATLMGLNLLSVAYCIYRFYVKPSKFISDVIYITLGTVLPLIIFISVVFQSLLSVQTTRNERGSRTTVNQVRRDVDTDNENITNPTSHPINQPSHTYFSTPYTGAFTQASFRDNSEERRPLISYECNS